MAKTNIGSMSVEQLLQLRDDIGKELNRNSTELRSQLARLGGEIASSRGRGGSLKGKKVPPKYRDRSGNTWAGRGAKPRWLVAAIKEGKKLEDFAIEKTAPGRKRRKKINSLLLLAASRLPGLAILLLLRFQLQFQTAGNRSREHQTAESQRFQYLSYAVFAYLYCNLTYLIAVSKDAKILNR